MATQTGIIMLVYVREVIAKCGGLEKIESLEELRQAVIEGAVHRLRPKLLAEGVAIIAIFPMVFATGVVGEILAPMALPILGGLLISDEVVDIFCRCALLGAPPSLTETASGPNGYHEIANGGVPPHISVGSATLQRVTMALGPPVHGRQSGLSVLPNAVSEYSTLEGICACTLRLIDAVGFHLAQLLGERFVRNALKCAVQLVESLTPSKSS